MLKLGHIPYLGLELSMHVTGIKNQIHLVRQSHS